MTEPKTMLSGGKPVTEGYTEINPDTGMQKGYLVLAPEEVAKGFVRPFRTTYIHTGRRAEHPLRDLTPEEHERYDQYGYVKYEEYPEGSHIIGRYWTEKDLRSGCGQSTRMSDDIAATYARDPTFYGGAFCATCRAHFGHDQFEWEDGSQLGS